MKINIIVSGSVLDSQAHFSALKFAEAAVAKGQLISQVFFYRDAISVANAMNLPLADEFDAQSAWLEFASFANCDLSVCISAAEKRGVVNQQAAKENGLDTCNAHSGFNLVGLGVLHDAILSADRTVTFR